MNTKQATLTIALAAAAAVVSMGASACDDPADWRTWMKDDPVPCNEAPKGEALASLTIDGQGIVTDDGDRIVIFSAGVGSPFPSGGIDDCPQIPCEEFIAIGPGDLDRLPPMPNLAWIRLHGKGDRPLNTWHLAKGASQHQIHINTWHGGRS